MYYGKPKRQRIAIGGKNIWFDSKLELSLAEWFEANGFAERWQRPSGIEVNGARYTYDFELAIQRGAKTVRALIEVKPAKKYITPAMRTRMILTAQHYKDSVILLYFGGEKKWYELEPKTRKLIATTTPLPGAVKLKSLPKPLTLPSSRTKSHAYEKRFHPILSSIGFVLNVLIELITGPKTKRKSRRR